MRCLKIPNTKAFAEVTVIQDAVNLHAALEAKKEGQWERGTDEEYEAGAYTRPHFGST
jgi:hypothetical protein